MSKKEYIIGIDLGTTNSTLSYCLKNDEKPTIHQFAIPQMMAAGVFGENLSLPSFLYFPVAEELNAQTAGVPWDSSRHYVIGQFARDRGAEVPSRLISSAKSWLCNTGLDRREKNLPVEAEEELEKISPLETCAFLLQHIKEAWEMKNPDAPLQNQDVFITVPASFDPHARQLVQEAATLAGFPKIVLLEEPQAAFYAWLYNHQEKWRSELKVNDAILVVDIGGGTTDFSLISVGDQEGELTLNRVAVGSHLLLGGDNIDLSLAYLVRQKFEEEGKSLDDWQFRALMHSCRQAKEVLLSEDAPKQTEITILGRGSRLIGGSQKIKVTQAEIKQLVVDGFFPLVSPDKRSSLQKRSGLQQIGLPYAQDARITCQLAKFLSMTGEVDSLSMDQFIVPTAVLFNGGTLKASALRERILEQLNQWATDLKKGSVKELPEPDYDYGVGRGAVYYALSCLGNGVRIKSGTSRSYFIGVEDSAPAVPGFSPPLNAICIVPFGMEEGSEQSLENRDFALVVGEPATFRFFSHATVKLSNGDEPLMGSVVKQWKQELSELHPIETLLERGELDGKTIRVKLKTHITELGVLEIWCVAEDGRKWKLEFDIRKDEAAIR